MTAGTVGLVAVIDDDTGVADSFRFLLEVSGFRVASYRSAAEFLAVGAAAADCMIIDQHMPQMTGLELVEQLDGSLPRDRIMLITGSSSPYIRDRAAALGVAKVIDKPLSEGELLAFVRGCGRRVK